MKRSYSYLSNCSKLRFITSVFLFCSLFFANAQKKFSVSLFEQLTFDLTASTSSCVDTKGNACALIKAYIPSIKEAIFEGNVVKQEYNQGEYSVYVEAGTPTINVTHPSFGKLVISTSEWGVKLESKITYRLVLQNKEKNSGIRKGCGDVKIVTNPEMSAVIMDGMYVGQSPLLLNNVKNGKHTLTLARDHEVEITVKEGVLNSYKYKLRTQDKIKSIQFQDDNNLYGLKNGDGEIVVEATYDGIGYPDSNDDFCGKCGWIVKKNGKYGFLSYEGKEIAPCIYDDISCEAYTGSTFPEAADPSFHIVELNGKYGFIDATTGKLSIPIIFDGVQGFSEHGVVMYAILNGEWCIVDRTGEIVVKDFEETDYARQSSPIVAIRRNGKWGLVNASKNGVPITDFVYEFSEIGDDDSRDDYKNEQEFVNMNTHLTRIDSKISDDEVLVGFANSDGVIIIPPMYSVNKPLVYESKLYHNGLCFLGIHGKYAIFDEFGNQLTKFIYLDYQDFYDGIAYVKTENGKWIKIDKSKIRK